MPTAPSHYLNQCWPSWMMSNGIIWYQWVNKSTLLEVIDPTMTSSTNSVDQKFWCHMICFICFFFFFSNPLLLQFGPVEIQVPYTLDPNLVINSLAPGRSEYDSTNVIFNLDLLIGIFRFPYGNAVRWMPQDLTDDKSTLVQVMAWCRQATSHYLSNADTVPCRLMALLGHN